MSILVLQFLFGTRNAYPLLEATELAWGQRVGLADDGDDIDTGRKTAHQLDVHFPQAIHNKCSAISQQNHEAFPSKIRTYAWPVGGIKYNNAWTRLSLKRGLRLIRLSSAKISSY